MKKILPFLLIFLFMSCATSNKVAVKHVKKYYFASKTDQFLTTIRGKLSPDGKSVTPYPPNATHDENGGELQTVTVAFSTLPCYYVLDTSSNFAMQYRNTSNNSLEMEYVTSSHYLPLEFNRQFVIALDSKKMKRATKTHNKKITDTWVNVYSNDDTKARELTFTEDGYVTTEDNSVNEYYRYYNKYQDLGYNFYLVKKYQVSLLEDNIIENSELFYFDGNYLYSIEYPLEDVYNDIGIKNALDSAKYK